MIDYFFLRRRDKNDNKEQKQLSQTQAVWRATGFAVSHAIDHRRAQSFRFSKSYRRHSHHGFVGQNISHAQPCPRTARKVALSNSFKVWREPSLRTRRTSYPDRWAFEHSHSFEYRQFVSPPFSLFRAQLLWLQSMQTLHAFNYRYHCLMYSFCLSLRWHTKIFLRNIHIPLFVS